MDPSTVNSSLMRRMLKFCLYSSAYPIVFFIQKIKRFKFIKLAELDHSRIGHTIYITDGFLAARGFSDELKNCKIILFSSFFVCNTQIKKMIKRVIPLSFFRYFFIFLKKAFLYWNKKDHVLNTSKFNLPALLTDKKLNIDYKKSNLFFTEKEKRKGLELIKKFGLKENDKWICIHNRDSAYLDRTQPNNNWSYHDHRNFSIEKLKMASEFFADNGYYVFRMGREQKEKLISKNKKIIDYANSSSKSDFLDVYLSANSDFYFGSDSGLKGISISFMRPCYGINWSPMLLYSDPGLFINSNNKYHPWLFIFKRAKSLKTGKMLTLKEILETKPLYSHNSNIFMKNNIGFVDNDSKEIKSLAEEIIMEKEEKSIENKEDIKIKNEFWKIYFKYSGKEKIRGITPRISPTFLRNNIDLLN